MMVVQIKFLKGKEILPELDRKIEEIDQLAFADEDRDDPDLKGIEWSASQWMALAFINNQLVSQLGMLKREILVGKSVIPVVGVGGVATHPQWQKRGLASQLLKASESFMRDRFKLPFGLLVCAGETQPLYAGCGWQPVAQSLKFIQEGQRRTINTVVMVLLLSTQPWPPGEIDLCGLPW